MRTDLDPDSATYRERVANVARGTDTRLGELCCCGRTRPDINGGWPDGHGYAACSREKRGPR